MDVNSLIKFGPGVITIKPFPFVIDAVIYECLQ
jgi:hypothetical protein